MIRQALRNAQGPRRRRAGHSQIAEISKNLTAAAHSVKFVRLQLQNMLHSRRGSSYARSYSV